MIGSIHTVYVLWNMEKSTTLQKTFGIFISGFWALRTYMGCRYYWYFRKTGGIFGNYYTPGVFSAIDKTQDMMNSGAKKATHYADHHAMMAEKPGDIETKK